MINYNPSGNTSSGGSTPIADPTYSTYTPGQLYSGQFGLCRFSIKGQNAKITPETPGEGFIQAYYYLSESMRGKTPILPHTQANICLNGNAIIDLGDMYGISGTYRFGGVSYTVDDVYDEHTQSSFIQRISNDWYPKADYLTEDWITLDSNNGVVFELRIPESAFGDQVPYKNSPNEYKPAVCPMSRMISEKHLLSLTTHDQLYNQYMSFAWHEPNSEGATDLEKSGYYSLHLSSKTDGSTKAALRTALFWSKWFIRYTLAEPILKKNTAKLYMNSGDTLTLQTKTGGYDAIVNYIQTPDNIAAATKGVEFLSEDVNDLNKRVENVEISEASVGYPDGTTDNYDAIVALIDANTNSGVNKVIDIPAGTYYISRPITISTDHTTIRGNGEVIIKCPTGKPAFILQANYIEIRGVTFWISKTEDSAAAESDDGLHCGIFIDSGRGTYNTKIIDCDFQGAYRLSTKNIERSYGIYIPDQGNSVITTREWGFAYFNIIENCRFYSVYCGLYLGDCVQPSKIWFSFDKGDNIYNISGLTGSPCYNTIGCGYGCICKGSLNTIRYDGQFVGENHTNPTNPVFETVDGVKTVKSATINNLSICGIKVEGGANYIEGYAFDGQRADNGQLWFTKTAKSNRFLSLHYGATYRFTDSITFNSTYTVYDSDGTSYSWNPQRTYRYLTDENGSNFNICPNPRVQNEPFLASDGIEAVATDGTYSVGPCVQHHGMQDNALAFIDKWGGHNDLKAVDVKFIQSDGTNITNASPWLTGDPSTLSQTADCSTLFSPTSEAGFTSSGLCFMYPPATATPIYLDLQFGKKIKLDRLVIRFNNYIAKDFDVVPFTNYSTTPLTDGTIAIRGNNLGAVNMITKHPTSGYWPSATGLRIIFYEALKAGSYNSAGFVGLSNIFALSSENGGMSYLPRSGGELYGDIKVNGSKLATAADISAAANNVYCVHMNRSAFRSSSKVKLLTIPNYTADTKVIVNYQAYDDSAKSDTIVILNPNNTSVELNMMASNKYDPSVSLDSSGNFYLTPGSYFISQSNDNIIQFKIIITDSSHVITALN